MENHSTKRTLSVEEAAEELGISRGLAYQLVGQGEIPSLKLGRRILIPQRIVDEMLDGPGRRAS